ncbi:MULTISPECIES: hypothetical protein [Pelistega]|nr:MULTISPECIES: hypothetical protein [Pelistega]
MKLYQLASSRAGDKGNISNLSLIAYDQASYDLIKEKVTPERVKDYFQPMVPNEELKVDRYELPQLKAFNFVITGLLNYGVTLSLSIDAHGKSLSFYLLNMEI